MGTRNETFADRRSAVRILRGLWRKKLREVWLSVQWLVIGVLFIVALLLGYQAFQNLDYGPSDALYRALQLFGLEAGAIDNRAMPLELQIARFLAPGVSAYIALGALAALFRDELQLLGIRVFTRSHILIAGAGRKGFNLATSFHEASFRAVVIEKDSTNPLVEGCRQRGIPVIIGDAADPRLLARARLRRARYLVLACDDGTNLNIAVSAGSVVRRSEPIRLTTFVNLDDLKLWRLLQSEAIAAPAIFPFRVEFFSVGDLAARALLDRHPPFPETAADRRASPHIVVVGLGGVGENVVLRAAGRWVNAAKRPEETLRITIIGPSAKEERDALVLRHQQLDRVCEVEAREMGFDADAARRSLVSPDDHPTAIYVCLPDDNRGLSAALALRAALGKRQPPIVVTVGDRKSGVARLLEEARGALQNVYGFATLDSSLTPELFLHATNEILARARHDEYIAGERIKGIGPEENPSVVPWEQLPESLKESNRAFARGIGTKLEAANCAIIPAPLVGIEDSGFQFRDEEIEDLARMEHERWRTDALADGWRFTAGEKDPVGKLHPKLVDWSELSEEERDKDRSGIRALPQMLARAGFEIYRRDPVSEAS